LDITPTPLQLELVVLETLLSTLAGQELT